MTNAANGDIYRAKVNWTLHGQQVYCTMHFLADGTPDIETNLANRIAQDVQNYLNAWASIQLNHNNVMVQRVHPTLGVPYIDSNGDASSRAGDINQQAVPTQCCCVLQLRTATGGRSSRGRMYLPGGAVTNLNVGLWSVLPSALVTNLTTHFITAVAPRWRLGVLSRKVAGIVPPLNPAGFYPATSLTLDTTPGVLRSRRIGKGR